MLAGWLRSLQEEYTLETMEYGVGTFVYRTRRPFLRKRSVIRDVALSASFLKTCSMTLPPDVHIDKFAQVKLCHPNRIQLRRERGDDK